LALEKMLKKVFQNKVFKNFSYLTIGNSISQFIGFVVMIKIAGIFSPSNYGIYTFLYTQGLLLMNIGDLGLKNIIIRSIARDNSKTKGLISTGIKIKVIAILLLTVVYTLYNFLWGTLNSTQIILIFSFALISCITNLLEIVFLGYQKMIVPSVINIFGSLIWLFFIFFAPSSVFKDVNTLFLIYTLISLIKVSVYYICIKKQHLDIGVKADSFFVHAKQLMKESMPYFNLMLLMLPIVYLSNNYLQINSTDAEIGYFNLANKLMMPVTLVLNLALASLFPNLSILWEKDRARFIRRISVGYRIFVAISLLLAFVFTLFSKDIIDLLLPEDYLNAVEVCQLQIWYVFFMGVNSLIGTLWGAMNLEKMILKTAIVNTLISTPFLFYGSKYGAFGLSYGYVISFALFEFYLWYMFKKSIVQKQKNDIGMWLLVAVAFFSSFYFLEALDVIWKLLVMIGLMGVTSFYLYKKRNQLKLLWA